MCDSHAGDRNRNRGLVGYRIDGAGSSADFNQRLLCHHNVSG
jgi:hypothetical protein